MIFLNPTILFGLLAASIPVLLHFLNLKKIKKVEFSTLTFLKELQKTKIKKIKFKQWLLLLLRILIIFFLVSSFARPTLESVAISGTGAVAKTTAIFILDNSFSMSVVDDNGSYFNQAKQIIIDLVSDFNEGDEISLLLTSNPQKHILLSNRTLVEKDIRKIEISYITNPLTETILAASELISNSQTYNKEVYILSDFQESTLTTKTNSIDTPKFEFDQSTKLYQFKFGGKKVQNLSVNELIPINQILEVKKEIEITTKVTNSSEEEVNEALLSIFFNGEINAHQNFSVKSGATKLLNYKTTLKHSGVIELVAELEEDDIEYDNKFYSILNVPEKITVLINSDDLEDSKYINLALSTSSESLFSIDEIKGNQINTINLSNYDCVFLIGIGNIIKGNNLNQFVKSGGRMIIMPSSSDTNEDATNVLNSFGITDFGRRVSISEENQFNSFENINYKHPLFQNIFNEINPRIESPRIISYIKNSPSGNGESIITLLDGSSFLSEYKYETGRFFLFNVSPVLTWSDLPLKSIFAPIINRSVYYLTSNRNSSKGYLAGEIIMIDISNLKMPQVKVIRPDKSEEYINIDSNLKFLKYNNSDQIGIYKFYSENELIDAVAVNVDLNESNLKQFSQIDFELLLKENNFKGTILTMDNSNYKDEITQARFGSELWSIFLLITLILALLEMLIAKNARKELADLNN